MRCRYWKVCRDYRRDSETCNEGGGGSYCGTYRLFAARENVEREVEYILELLKQGLNNGEGG